MVFVLYHFIQLLLTICIVRSSQKGRAVCNLHGKMIAKSVLNIRISEVIRASSDDSFFAASGMAFVNVSLGPISKGNNRTSGLCQELLPMDSPVTLVI